MAIVEKQEENGKLPESLSLEATLDFLEDRQYNCPCCDERFTDRRVRMSKLKLHGCDSDLRPLYSPVDPLLYDVIICSRCGYGALAKTFDNLSFKNAQIIMSALPGSLKNVIYPRVYTEDIAIKRYRAALLNALLIREKSSLIGYLYMKLAWIYRSKGNAAEEKRMLLASFEGLLEATKKEAFPIIDLDELTTYYVMGDFLCRLGKPESAKYFFKKALVPEGGIAPDLKRKILERPFMSCSNTPAKGI